MDLNKVMNEIQKLDRLVNEIEREHRELESVRKRIGLTEPEKAQLELLEYLSSLIK